jgi:DNA-directed RNA polymerase subunit M/transcription elongation factor TFIIS
MKPHRVIYCKDCGKVGVTRISGFDRGRCPPCYAAYMRKKQAVYRATPAGQFKDMARNKANDRLQRGKIEKQPCRDCGSPDSQMHHEDYSQPLDVVWLCRQCHLDLHKRQNAERAAYEIAEFSRKWLAAQPPKLARTPPPWPTADWPANRSDAVAFRPR